MSTIKDLITNNTITPDEIAFLKANPVLDLVGTLYDHFMAEITFAVDYVFKSKPFKLMFALKDLNLTEVRSATSESEIIAEVEAAVYRYIEELLRERGHLYANIEEIKFEEDQNESN